MVWQVQAREAAELLGEKAQQLQHAQLQIWEMGARLNATTMRLSEMAQRHGLSFAILSAIFSEGTITRVSCNPTLAQRKKGPSLEVFCLCFLCLRPKRAPQNLRQTLVTSDIRVSLVKALPDLSGTDMTGRPGDRAMEMLGGSTASHLARSPCVPVCFAYF